MTRKKRRSRLSLGKKIILLFNIIAGFGLLSSYLASLTDPNLWWWISFLGLMYPILLVMNACFIVYWIVRGPPFALISFFVILIGWKFLVSYIGFRTSTAIGVPKSSRKFIRMMTYNVHEFKKFGSRNDLPTKELFLKILQDEQPDVICFQEFFTRKKGTYNFKKWVAEVLQTKYYYYHPTKGNAYETMGLAIFSKFPILRAGVLKFHKQNHNGSIFADININNRMVRVYNVHFQSIRFKPEDYHYIDNIKQQLDADVKSSRRIGSRLKQAFIKRSNQVDLVRQHALGCSSPYIVAGDFNDTPISYTVNRMLSAGLLNAFREKGSGFGATYNGAFPNFQIDYIMATPHFSINNYRLIPKKISDHYAVRSDLELKDPQ